MLNTRVSWAKSGFVCLMIVARVLTNTGGVAAQSSDPSSLPLLSSGGLEYAGGFRLPGETVNGMSFSYGGQAVAYDPATNSLFISSLGYVAEVSIPAPVISSDVSAMPFARLLQPFEDPSEGHLRDLYDGDAKMEGLMVYGNRLYGTGYIYFDASNVQRVSHYSRSRQLNQPSFSGWSQVWETGGSGFVAGMMSLVPSEWQAKLGGKAITGQCCIPIVWRTSSGPAAFAFDPAQVGQPTASATPLLYYPGDHATLGSWSGANPTYGSTTQILGVAVIAGTRTVLYFGRNGMGTYCYGTGTPDQSLVGTTAPEGGPYCYDPTNSYKAPHAYPYRYQIWAYDLNDFAAVKAGTKQPWDVVPYGVWPLNLPTPESTMELGGVGYDAQRQILYVSQMRADHDGCCDYRPIIHAFRVNATPGAGTAPSNVVSSVTLTADKTAPQAVGTPVTFTAQPTGGVAPYQYKWIVSNGSTSTIAVNWTTSNRFTWTPTVESANYSVSVWVRSAGNAADVLEASTYLVFPVANTTKAIATISVALTANRVAPQAPFTPITWTATPAGGVAPHQYKWRIFDGTTWTVGASWSPTNSFVWTPSTANPNYRVEVWLRSAGSTADAPEASTASPFPIEAQAAGTGPVASVSLTANRTAPQPAGNPIAFTATPTGGTTPVVYKWFYFMGTTWTAFGDWSSSQNFTWYPTEPNANYRIRVWVKGAANTADQAEASAELPFAITATGTAPTAPTPTPVSSVALIPDKPSPQPAGNAIGFTGKPSGGTSPYLYKWFYFMGTTWTAFGDWSSNSNFTWYPTEPNANYRIRVWVKNAANTADQPEATAEQSFSITGVVTTTPVSSVRLTSDKSSPQGIGTPITFTATPSGGTAPFVYKWSVSGGAAPITTAWGSSNTFTWTPTTANNNYRVSVSVKRASNAADQAEATSEVRFNINTGKGNGKD
jgi:hypothetical protein